MLALSERELLFELCESPVCELPDCERSDDELPDCELEPLMPPDELPDEPTRESLWLRDESLMPLF